MNKLLVTCVYLWETMHVYNDIWLQSILGSTYNAYFLYSAFSDEGANVAYKLTIIELSDLSWYW
jgi:hypothetical protein